MYSKEPLPKINWERTKKCIAQTVQSESLFCESIPGKTTGLPWERFIKRRRSEKLKVVMDAENGKTIEKMI